MINLLNSGKKEILFQRINYYLFVEALGEEIPHDEKRKEFKKTIMEFFSLKK